MAEVGGISNDHLQQLIERVERLEDEKSEIAAQVREVFAEAKNAGFDVKVMRMLLKLRKMDQNEIDEQETLLHLYKQALGMS